MAPWYNFGGDQLYFSKKTPKNRLDVTAMSRHAADAAERVALEMGAAGQLVHVFLVSTRPLSKQLEAAKNKENSIDSIEQSIFHRG